MILSFKEKVVLYGSGEKISEFLNSDMASSLDVVGLCRDSLLDDDPIFDTIQNVSFDQLKSGGGGIVVIVNNDISQNGLDYFERNSIVHTLSKDIVLMREQVQEESNEESNDESNDEVVEEAEEIVNNDDVIDLTAELLGGTNSESNEVIDEENEEALPKLEEPSPEIEEPLVSINSEPSVFTDEQFELLNGKLTAYYDEVIKFVNYSKSKDTSIYNINKELQKFKDGYFSKICNPMIVDIIALREDCKKSLENINKYALNKSKQAMHLECTVEEIENFLTVYGVSIENGIYSYNGKVFHPSVEAIETLTATNDEVDLNSVQEMERLELAGNTLEAVNEFLLNSQQRIEALLSREALLMDVIAKQSLENQKQQKVTDGVLLKPIFIKVINLSDYLQKRINELSASLGDEDASEIYQDAYSFTVDYLEKLLLTLGVQIRSNIDDTFEPKYHRMLKMVKIEPEEAEKDKKIAEFCTDCYVSDDKVISPAKVIIYRL